MKIYGKMARALEALEFFTTHEFEFCTANTKKLEGQLNLTDKQLFNVYVDSIEWKTFIQNYVAGMRKYLLNESDESLEVVRARYKR